jgi:hypothetical protein
MTNTLHHLADAIAALRAAYESAAGDEASEHIMSAEKSAFRAIKAIVDGQWQFSPEDEHVPASS